MSFEIYQDRSDGAVLVGTTRTMEEAVALIAAQPHALALDDTSQVLCTSDPTQLVFLASVLDDAGLRLVTAWEPQTAAADGAIGIFERGVS